MGWVVPGFNPGRDKKFLASPQHPDGPWGPLSLVTKRSRRENDHGPLSVAEVKNEWNYSLEVINISLVDSVIISVYNLR